MLLTHPPDQRVSQDRPVTGPALQHALSFIHSLTQKWGIILTKVSQHVKTKKSSPQGTLEPRFFVLSPCAKARLASDTGGSSQVETAFFQISTFIGLTTNDDWNLIFTSKYKQQGEIRLQRSNWWLLLLQGGVLVAIKVDKVPSCTVFLWIWSWRHCDPEKPFNFSVNFSLFLSLL